MRATTRTFTPTIVGLLSIIALLLALLATGTAEGTAGDDPVGNTEECVDNLETDVDECAKAIPEHDFFKDLPDDFPHVDGISWLAENALTNGCADGKYCPNKPLKRGELASFLYRYHTELGGTDEGVDVGEGEDPPTVEELKAAIEDVEATILELKQQVDALATP